MQAITVARILCFAGVALALVSGSTVSGLASRERSKGRLGPPTLTGAYYCSTLNSVTREAGKVWRAPVPHSRGMEWRYDLFTPPPIFYDVALGRLNAGLPNRPKEKTIEPPFDLELVSVKREPFPLQLIGHSGENAEANGVFQNLVTGEVFLARTGHRVADLALRIETFEVREQLIALADSMSVTQRIGTARIYDESRSCWIELTDRERQFAGKIGALVKAKENAKPRQVYAGDVFEIDEVTYRVGEISVDPPSAEIVRTAPFLKTPDRRFLSLRSGTTEVVNLP